MRVEFRASAQCARQNPYLSEQQARGWCFLFDAAQIQTVLEGTIEVTIVLLTIPKYIMCVRLCECECVCVEREVFGYRFY